MLFANNTQISCMVLCIQYRKGNRHLLLTAPEIFFSKGGDGAVRPAGFLCARARIALVVFLGTEIVLHMFCSFLKSSLS